MSLSFRLSASLLRLACLLGLLAQVPARAEAPLPQVTDAQLRGYLELARTDLEAQKSALIVQNMDLTAAEADKFWPVVRAYTAETSKLTDRRVLLIRQHYAQYGLLSDAETEKFAREVFDLEADRVKLKQKWFKKFTAVVPARKAARFFQIENQVDAVIDLKIAAAMPLIK
jgi:hypothetical protein